MLNYDGQIQIPVTGNIMQYWYIVHVATECMVALAIVAEAYPHRHFNLQ